jgi:hypothetical protein
MAVADGSVVGLGKGVAEGFAASAVVVAAREVAVALAGCTLQDVRAKAARRRMKVISGLINFIRLSDQ